MIEYKRVKEPRKTECKILRAWGIFPLKALTHIGVLVSIKYRCDSYHPDQTEAAIYTRTTRAISGINLYMAAHYDLLNITKRKD